MADIRITKQGVESVAETSAYAGQTRTSLEIAGSKTANSADLKLTKFAVEVIGDSPNRAGKTRTSLEIAGSKTANSADLKLTKFAVEAIASQLAVLDTTRISVEIAGSKTDTSSGLNITKIGTELVARTSPSLPAALPEPSYWKVFCHNWANTIKLSTAYLTDITRSPYDLTEERRNLLNRPFRTLTFKWRALKRESLDAMFSYIKRMTNHRIFIPLYCDQIALSNTFTAALDTETFIPCNPSFSRVFANQRIAFVRLDEDLVPISADIYTVVAKEPDYIEVTDFIEEGTYYKGRAVILPCMDTELVLAPKIELQSPNLGDLEITLFEATESSALPPVWTGLLEFTTDYQGYPVFNFEPDWALGRPRFHLKREGEISNQAKGRIARTEGDRYRVMHSFPLGLEKEDFFNLLKFFDSRRGRTRAFWLTDLDYTWQFAGQGGTGNIYLDIQPINTFADFSYNVNDDFTHVGVVMSDGTVYIREVTAFDDTGSVFRLTISGLPTLNAANIVRIARARLTRFLKDALEEEWTTTNYTKVTVETIELLNDTEVVLE